MSIIGLSIAGIVVAVIVYIIYRDLKGAVVSPPADGVPADVVKAEPMPASVQAYQDSLKNTPTGAYIPSAAVAAIRDAQAMQSAPQPAGLAEGSPKRVSLKAGVTQSFPLAWNKLTALAIGTYLVPGTVETTVRVEVGGVSVSGSAGHSLARFPGARGSLVARISADADTVVDVVVHDGGPDKHG